MAGSWFPFASELLKSAEFLRLPDGCRVYFLQLVSQFNLRKAAFYQSDYYYAETLHCEERTVRRWRTPLVKMGLIGIKRGGWRRGQRRIATTYLRVGFADVDSCPDVPGWPKFAAIHRYTFDEILTIAGNPSQIWTWVVLWAFRERVRANGDFFITKSELRQYAGEKALQAVKQIPQALARSEAVGKRKRCIRYGLFSCVDEYHRFKISEWVICANPSEDARNAVIAENRKSQLTERVQARRDMRKRTCVRGQKGADMSGFLSYQLNSKIHKIHKSYKIGARTRAYPPLFLWVLSGTQEYAEVRNGG